MEDVWGFGGCVGFGWCLMFGGFLGSFIRWWVAFWCHGEHRSGGINNVKSIAMVYSKVKSQF